MKTSIKILIATFVYTLGISHAQIASDNAGNYTTWTNGSNEGFGFGDWVLNSDAGGHFLGNADEQGPNNTPLDTSGQSFGIFADNFSVAVRPFNTDLQVGDVLNFSIAYQFDNGNKGFNLQTDNGTNVFNFNVNDAGYTWAGGGSSSTTPWDNVRENGVLIDFSFSRTATGIDYTFFSDQDATLSQSGNFTTADPVGQLEFYVSGAGGGPGGNLYFNNLQVIPEPATLLLLLGGLGVIAAYRRKLRA